MVDQQGAGWLSGVGEVSRHPIVDSTHFISHFVDLKIWPDHYSSTQTATRRRRRSG